VFLAHASALGHALIDRELYLPQSWTGNRDRCRVAGIPDAVEFATKARLAQQMLARALDVGVPFSWFTAGEIYGQAPCLRAWLEEQGVSYVLAIRRCDTFTTAAGQQRAGVLIAALPTRSWQRLSAGAGAHGPRDYHWAWIPIPARAKPGRTHWLLPRRSLANPGEIAYYACYGPARTRLVDRPGWPAAAGTSKNASSKPRARPACATTRPAPGGPGTHTPPCPCWPWPGWPPAGLRPQEGNRLSAAREN
jgi:hypothetical protein